MASRRIMDLAPRVRTKVLQAMAAWEAAGLDVLVTCTYRSNEEQDALYAQGRTTPGRIVTHARAGQSKHNWLEDGKPAALAVDIVPLRSGKLVWGTSGNGIDDDPADDDKDDLELWERVALIAEACGLRWAGRWVKWREYAHFEG